MSNTPNAEPEITTEFDLKHRLTGAAVLLFISALVLPWLLGPPSEASKIELSDAAPVVLEVEPADIAISRSSTGDSPQVDDIEETVYISKITPLDAKGNSSLINAAKKAVVDSSQADNKSPNSETGKKSVGNTGGADGKTSARKESIPDIKTSKKVVPESVSVAAVSEASSAVDIQKQSKLESELQAALADEIRTQKKQDSVPPKVTPDAQTPEQATRVDKVTVGWIVQVGLFTDKSLANGLISQLKLKGFSASSSVVDTNRGEKTGTRVWLGPFAKRVSAINEQKRLKSSAGRDGFIRVYP